MLLRCYRKAIVLGTVLLAITLSLPATSCFCADGTFKLFCAGNYTRAVAKQPAEGHCCSCAHASGGQRADHHRDAPCGRCREVSKPLGTTVSSVIVPRLDWSVTTPIIVDSGAPFTSLSHAAQVQPIDTGPPVDLVIALHFLLI